MAEYALLKQFYASIDLTGQKPVPVFEVVRGDTGSVLNVSVTEGQSAVSLEDMLVTAVFTSSVGTRFLDSRDGSITLEGNTAAIRLLPTAFGPGPVACELQIRSSSGEDPQTDEDYDILVTTARFNFFCRESMLTRDALEALPETPLLDAFLNGAAQAEQARQAAEAARQTAESARVLAEQARAAAEQARQQGFESLLAAAIGISKTGNGAPNSRTEGSEGQLYFDLINRRVYVCTGVDPVCVWRELAFADGDANELTVERISSTNFEDIPYNTDITLQELLSRLGGWYPVLAAAQAASQFDEAPTANSTAAPTSGGVYAALHEGDWVNISSGTLTADAASINISGYSAGFGSGGFSFDELRLIYAGEMSGGGAARVFLNGGTGNYLRFASFAHADTDDPEACMTLLHLEKPMEGFAVARRIYGGDSGGSGYSVSSAVHGAVIKLAGLTKYTAIKLTAEGAARFASGAKIILQGRNRR